MLLPLPVEPVLLNPPFKAGLDSVPPNPDPDGGGEGEGEGDGGGEGDGEADLAAFTMCNVAVAQSITSDSVGMRDRVEISFPLTTLPSRILG